MPKKFTKDKATDFTNLNLELVKWPLKKTLQLSGSVLAIQTTRNSFHHSINNDTENTPSYGYFNLGLHVGDIPEQVEINRNRLKKFISQQLFNCNTFLKQSVPIEEIKETAVRKESADNEMNIQWLEQVHGCDVVTVSHVEHSPLKADASITREKNIALAIMTADCLPILLTNTQGTEVAAIHGGWRPLAANILTKTIEKMQSNTSELVAWLGPCIGLNAFEVGSEVKNIFCEQNVDFERAFEKQINGKYLANLHVIAKQQLYSLGIENISELDECTFHESAKYYSYRKIPITGRMASIICRT